jgi:hypothetical protein
LASELLLSDREQIETNKISTKYSISPNDLDSITAQALKYYLSEVTEKFQCKIEGDAIAIVNKEGSIGYFYKSVAKALLKGWDLTYGQCKQGITIQVVTGKRIQ